MSQLETDLLSGRRRALIIATAQYTDATLRALRAPTRDAADLGDLLSDVAVARFDVTRVLDRSAAEIRQSIVEFLNEAVVDEFVLIYLSCHGVLDSHGRLYFAATDTRHDMLAANGVSAHWLLDQLEESGAHRQVLILDCCFSGSFDVGRVKSGEFELLHELRMNRDRGRLVFTASRDYEYSFEGEPVDIDGGPSGSIYTSGFIEGIRTGKADSNGDGYISAEEAHLYAAQYVKDQKSPQTPQKSAYAMEGRLWLARNPTLDAMVQPAPLPEPLRARLDNPVPGIQLAAVSDLGDWLRSGNAAQALAAQQELNRIAQRGIALISAAAQEFIDEVPSRAADRMANGAIELSGHRDWVRSLAFSTNGDLLASASDDKSVRIWRLGVPEDFRVLDEHREWVTSVAFSADGAVLASASADATVRIWDANTFASKSVLKSSSRSVNALAFDYEGTLLAAGGRDRHISLWNMQTELCERMLAGTGATVNALAISRAHLVLAGMDDGDIAIWDLGGDAMEVQRRHEGPVNTVAFHPSGRMYASAGSDAAIRICDLATSPAEQDLIGHEGAVRSVAFSPDGSLLASAGDDGVVRLWDPRTGKNVYTLEEHGMPVRCVAFSLDSGRLAAAGNDRIVRVWDLTASISQ